jgi:hypothetical protein
MSKNFELVRFHGFSSFEKLTLVCQTYFPSAGRSCLINYLAGGSDKAAFDKQTLKLIDEIEELEPSVKDKLIFLANAIIRDAKTGKAYAH